jgi:hypothetical protein
VIEHPLALEWVQVCNVTVYQPAESWFNEWADSLCDSEHVSIFLCDHQSLRKISKQSELIQWLSCPSQIQICTR